MNIKGKRWEEYGRGNLFLCYFTWHNTRMKIRAHHIIYKGKANPLQA
jgi:hypothetical protein